MVECSVTGSNYCPETENDLTIYYHMCLMISMVDVLAHVSLSIKSPWLT